MKLYPTEARSFDLFRSAFAMVKERMLEQADEIISDPAKCAAILPTGPGHPKSEAVRLGAYLSWWRDHGHEPHLRDADEWNDFIRYNATFPLSPNALGIKAVINEFAPGRNLTREQFHALAARQPSLEGRWIYRLEQIKAPQGISYPEFDICIRTYMFLDFAEARKAATGGECYCCRITQLPDGGSEDESGASWLYDTNGTLIDYSITTWEKDLLKSRFFGRPESRQRFHKGDIVEVIECDKVYLAVVGADMPSVDWFWDRYEKCKDLNRYFPDASDDCYYVIDGPGEAFHSHVPALALMKPCRPVPEEIRQYFKNCLESLENGEIL